MAHLKYWLLHLPIAKARARARFCCPQDDEEIRRCSAM